ncbi:hypothetical protein CQ14_30525 [Bradyrhizobium lablabi]|uniref:Uncharacterized protein n=1 Tax=Bradyrhizobium lablabi TaxID=722472 RepID=A0A0R3M8P8_9BRAD|nr:hypothetical protein CQ14_30525 [Bradyrhizobium lablabi]
MMPSASPVPAAGLGVSDRSDFINFLGVGLCDDFADAILAALAGFLTVSLAAGLAALRPTLAAGFLADAAVAGWAVLRAALVADGFRAGVLRLWEDGLEDFMRVFLDIRLPFVAFRRSTIRVLRVSPLTVGFAPAAGQL